MPQSGQGLIKIDTSVNMLRVHYACILFEFWVKSSKILLNMQAIQLGYWKNLPV